MALASEGKGHAREEDLRLMQLVAAEDPRARHMLAMRLCARIRRVSLALLASAADADDATQDTLVAIIGAAKGYRGESSIERWADRIAVRTGLKFRRRQRRWGLSLARDVDPDAVETPVDDDGRDALPRPVAEYLRRLPRKERQVLFLKHGLGYSTREIAELTDTPASTVKYRIAGALERVRKAIRVDCMRTASGGRS